MCMFMMGSRASEVRGSKARSSVVLQMSSQTMLAAWGGCSIACFVLVVAKNMKWSLPLVAHLTAHHWNS